MTKIALRKHSLNADLHIHALEDPQTGMDMPPEVQERHLIDICGSAILKGLDIIGIVSRNSYEPGELCKKIIQEKNYDLVCLSGIEIKSAEGLQVIVYNSKKIPQPGQIIEKICRIAHKNGGVVMAIQPSRRNVQKLNKLTEGTTAPDFIEIFNDITQGGYSKSFVDTSPNPQYQLLMNSASRNARDLDKSIMMSRIPRRLLIKKGILSEDQGVNYQPSYLQKMDSQNYMQRVV
jgi:hypothetical protein